MRYNKRLNAFGTLMLVCVGCAASDSGPTQPTSTVQPPYMAPAQVAPAAPVPSGNGAVGVPGQSTPAAAAPTPAPASAPPPSGVPAGAGGAMGGMFVAAQTGTGGVAGVAGMMAPPPAGAGGASGGAAAGPAPGDTGPAATFCDKYGKYCKFGIPQRFADYAACIKDFNDTPAQQFCKTMHLDNAISGQAAACNGMPSDFCFAIHCLHASGIVDQTGVLYCR